MNSRDGGSAIRHGANTPSLLRTLCFVMGAVVTAVGVLMLPAVGVAALNSEWSTALGILGAAALTVGLGSGLWRGVGRQGTIGIKEGFATVGLAWFAVSAVGALPYLFTGTIPGVTDAFFETASGFTTTGASILADPSVLPRGIGFWRGFTQWLGGMGVIVLSVAVLPLLGIGGLQLARAESPGVAPDRLTPRFQETAKRLWLVYVAFTVALFLLLVAGDMNMYQAGVHSLTTLSTGGFGTEADSIAGFSPFTQWTITVFMLISGTSFALHYRALRHPSRYLRNGEFRLYAIIAAVMVVIVAGGLITDEMAGDAVRNAAFTVTSILTTTGYATADFDAWRPALRVLIIGLMFIGGMAGSTSGSVKAFRVGILAKAAALDLRRMIYPRGVFTTRFGSDRIRPEVVESIQSFFLFYMLLFLGGTVALGFIDANLAEELDLTTAASAVAASLGNIGPGLGDVGPASNFAAIPGPGKWLLAFLMIVGRLEIFPVLLLFTRDLWRK